MFDFDTHFNRHDPYATLAAEILEQNAEANPRGGATCPIEPLWSLRDTPRQDLYKQLIKCEPGADLRPIALTAAHRAAVLVDVSEVFQLTAASVSLRLKAQEDHGNFRTWLQEEAKRAVDTCITEEIERNRINAELAFPLQDHHDCVRQILEVPLTRIRHAVTCINALPMKGRLPLMRILLQGTEVGDVVMESNRSMMDLLESMKKAIRKLQSQRINKEA